MDVADATGDPEVGGFSGGFVVDDHAYLVPGRSYQGPYGGVNTKLWEGERDFATNFEVLLSSRHSSMDHQSGSRTCA
jgi:hypothetical protein